jgi:ATP-dependent protease Clp ATPase subunit
VTESQQEKLNLRCSFCGKHQNEVHRLVAGSPTVCICSHCIDCSANMLGMQTVFELTSDAKSALRFLEQAIHPKPGCSFCHTLPVKNPKLIIGMTSIVVCNLCIEAILDILIEEEQTSGNKNAKTDE